MTGTNTFTNTDLVASIAEFWTPMVMEQFFASTCAANWFTDLSQYQSSGNDIYHVPNVYTNSFTVSTQSTQGTEVSLQSPAQTDVTLTVNNHVYIAYIIDDLARQQIAATYDMPAVYARKAAGQLANDLEGDLFALWSGLSTNTVGDTATVLTDLEIRQSIEKLASLNIPTVGSGETAWFFHPYVYFNQILGVAKYYTQSTFSDKIDGAVRTGNFGGMSRERGYMGDLYGMPLFISTNVVSGLKTYRNLLAHKTAFGFALQTVGGGKVRTQASPWLANLGVLTVHDMINGVAELRDQAAVLINANTTATTS